MQLQLILPLALLFLGLTGERAKLAQRQPSPKPKPKPQPSAARRTMPAKAAAPARGGKRTPAPARPAAASQTFPLQTEEEMRQRAGVDAAVHQAVKEHIQKTETSVSPASSSPILDPFKEEHPQPKSELIDPFPPQRTAAQAAKDLKSFLVRTKRFGTKQDKPEEVKAAQRDLGVKDDGIVGPVTRAAAKKAGTTLPAR